MINQLNRGKIIIFTDDGDFGLHTTKSGERISFTDKDSLTPAITRGCALLLDNLEEQLSDLEMIKVVKNLLKYIELTGDMPLAEDIRE